MSGGPRPRAAPQVDLAVRNIGQLVTCAPELGEGQLGLLRDAALLSSGGEVVWVGPERDLPAAGRGSAVAELDAGGRAVLPGFVDAHTHLVFAGDRAEEFAARLRGTSYAEALAAGGGINLTVAATRAASDADLRDGVRARADRALAHGTTTLEAKSGYGLSTDDERRCLQALGDVNSSHPLDIVRTFLGAHLIPREWADDRKGYLDLLEHEMLPACAPLAEFVDAFCDEGALTVGESRRVLEAGRRHGLAGRLHANELGQTGGALLAAEMGCVSADHLLHLDADEAAALARAGTIATLLPGTSFLLAEGRAAPVRVLREAGVRLALGTDCNPGTCYCESMQLVIALAGVHGKLTPEEAVLAATDGSAASLGRTGTIGRLAPGARADLIVLAGRSPLDLVYHLGVNLADVVVKGGRVVSERGQVLATSAAR